ncbi:FeoC-like transcriptional regulator [Orbus mooreae]|uniref:FeoC-like transcriptional regulator n=1 Tax=Orbus mooreae TaxID=3074107 RepID=UPI00370DA499
MLMTDISKYIELNGRASLLDLARHFNVQESAMQQMLSFWIKKGKISLVDASTSSNCSSGQRCSDCFECNDSAHQIYIWISST